MKITEHLYQISGVQYGTNSNIYALRTEEGLVLIDCGYQEEQWEKMLRCMKRWNLKPEDIRAVFLTHSHFDHAGNVWRMNELGADVFASPVDADKIEHGNPEMEELFGAKWKCGTVTREIREGDSFLFGDEVTVQVLETPGHSKGSLSFLIQIDGIRAICTGDLFFVKPWPPEDKVDVELGYMGGWDFDMKDYQNSLRRLRETGADLFLPGHYYFYRGQDVQQLFEMACEKAERGTYGRN